MTLSLEFACFFLQNTRKYALQSDLRRELCCSFFLLHSFRFEVIALFLLFAILSVHLSSFVYFMCIGSGHSFVWKEKERKRETEEREEKSASSLVCMHLWSKSHLSNAKINIPTYFICMKWDHHFRIFNKIPLFGTVYSMRGKTRKEVTKYLSEACKVCFSSFAFYELR